MQEAILFTIFLVGMFGGLTALHILGKIIGLFISKYEKIKKQKKDIESKYSGAIAYMDKLEDENHELRRKVLFYENERQTTLTNN